MPLEDYLAEINRNRCPAGCRFKDRGVGPAIVPPPRRIFGIVISNDPPVSWWPFYQYVMRSESEIEIRRRMLFSSAIPLSLLNRILDFKKWINERVSAEEEANLFHVMFERVYWTHMHKCFTDKGTEGLEPPRRARICANQWLNDELSHATVGETLLVVALGGNAREWISNWRDSLRGNRNLEKVKLPHPSLRNVGREYSWRPRQVENRSRLRQEVDRFIDLCGRIVL